jgi:aminoglycoside phosphotransferase (APT) family kinase protein
VRDEFHLLQVLFNAGFPAPKPLWIEANSKAVPGAFLVTQFLPGRAAGSHEGPRDPGSDILDMFARTLAHLHALPVDALGLSGYSDVAFDHTAVLNSIAHYRRWDEEHWDVREPILDLALSWLEVNVGLGLQPKVIVHGDYGFHNLLVDGRHAVLLDWEMAHPGSAAEDLSRARDGLGTLATFEEFLASYTMHGGKIPPPSALRYYDVLRLTRSTINYRNAVKLFNLGVNSSIRKLNATSTLYGRNLAKLANLIRSSVVERGGFGHLS